MGKMTIGALARASGLSRSTLLYYDRLGLLPAAARSISGYRLYSSGDADRLAQICLHRQMGISLREIGTILGAPGANAAVEILRRRLRTLDRSIEEMRNQQRCIVEILKQDSLQDKEINVINKKRWVEIMRAAGLSEEDMHNWHTQFEKMEPEAHQEFLESLGIKEAEIRKIREFSRGKKQA
jgi:DNA-binding transcriptional MerR regulator